MLQNFERLPAHSYVLAIASKPFEAMFYGDFGKNDEIKVPDADPVAFKVMLK